MAPNCNYNVLKQLDPSDRTCGSLPAFAAECVNGVWSVVSCAVPEGRAR